MEYKDKYKEYQNYIKQITDRFVEILTYNSEYSTPSYKRVNGEIKFEYTVDGKGVIFYTMDECPSAYDTDIKRPKDVVEAWIKIQNEQALIWLNNNVKTYDQWYEKLGYLLD